MVKSARPGANPYSLVEVAIATNNFNIQIGQGGFGPVYYGKLEDGQEVAIKVLDVKSNQGPSKFFNEVIYQHPLMNNLIGQHVCTLPSMHHKVWNISIRGVIQTLFIVM
ncbi:hypothetical protein CY35_19G004500 [Sphagnum magellanicum]|nr:hypothetical protein CY35_19G004500 [Sphagnum magellanicum]